MSTAAPLPYSLITVKIIELEIVTLSDMQSLKNFLFTQSLRIKGILFLVQIKGILFLFKFTSNFEHFQKKMTFIAYVFPKLPTSKDVV